VGASELNERLAPIDRKRRSAIAACGMTDNLSNHLGLKFSLEMPLSLDVGGGTGERGRVSLLKVTDTLVLRAASRTKTDYF
jgi:hypothetical protein